MSRRRRREGAGAIVREIRAQGDRIVAAIQQASADAQAGRVAMVKLGADSIRAALDEGARRAVVVNPGTGRAVQFTGNDVGETPPESGPQ